MQCQSKIESIKTGYMTIYFGLVASFLTEILKLGIKNLILHV